MKKAASLFLLAVLFASPAFCLTDEQNKKVLKDAVVGAITGAVATEATKDEPEPVSSTPAAEAKAEAQTHEKKKHKNFSHKKDKKRPHGWDMGKKTGWGDSDVPPGLAKKDK